MRFIVIIMAIAGLSVPALAQTELLPRTSPAEQQVRDINQSLQRQNQSRTSSSATISRSTSCGRTFKGSGLFRRSSRRVPRAGSAWAARVKTQSA